MLLVIDAVEDKWMSRAEDDRFGISGHHCFRYAEVLGRYCFHVHIRRDIEGKQDAWFHYVAGDIRGLLELLEHTKSTREVRVTVQTPFSGSEPCGMIEILELVKAYDKDGNEVYLCNCADKKSYSLGLSASRDLFRTATVWP